MDWQKHIERIPNVMVGKPIFRGTRITVEFVLERLAQGARPEDLVHSHPPLTAEQVSAALAYALSVVRQDELLETVREVPRRRPHQPGDGRDAARPGP